MLEGPNVDLSGEVFAPLQSCSHLIEHLSHSLGSSATATLPPEVLWSDGHAEQRVCLGMRSQGPRQEGVSSSNHAVTVQVNLLPDFSFPLGV